MSDTLTLTSAEKEVVLEFLLRNMQPDLRGKLMATYPGIYSTMYPNAIAVAASRFCEKHGVTLATSQPVPTPETTPSDTPSSMKCLSCDCELTKEEWDLYPQQCGDCYKNQAQKEES